MTPEEKAKAYDEAIKKASKLRVQNPFDTVSQMMEYLFPELAESEDERIRKGIKSILEHYKESGEVVCPYPFVSIDEAIAWLEKQGDVNALIQEAAEKSYTEGMRVERKRWLEKQDEPKQEENDQKCEPFRIKKGEWYVCIHDFCNKSIKIGEIIQAEHDNTIRGIGFLYMENKYFRPAFENEIPQKPKWNENDEHHLRMCLECVEECAFQDREDFSKTIDWLKSLKQRLEEQ